MTQLDFTKHVSQKDGDVSEHITKSSHVSSSEVVATEADDSESRDGDSLLLYPSHPSFQLSPP